MKQLLLFLSILALFSNCKQEAAATITNNHSNYTAFPKSMTSELDKIVSFFDKEVFEEVGVDSTDLMTCYTAFFKIMETQIETGTILEVIKEKDLEDFFSNLDTTVFNEIWRYDNRKYYLLPVFEGKYAKLLKIESRNNPNIARYFNSMKNSMVFGVPIMQEVILFNTNKTFDISNKNHRLILAIDYITSQYELHYAPKASHYNDFRGYMPIDFDLINFDNTEQLKSWLIKEVDVFSSSFIGKERIETINYETTTVIKNYGKVALYKVQLSNKLPTQMEKEYYITWSEAKKQIFVLPFSKIILFPLENNDSEYLIGGFSVLKRQGFLYFYDFNGLLLQQIFASEKFCKKPVWYFNEDYDCIIYTNDYFDIRFEDINNDGYNDFIISNTLENYCIEGANRTDNVLIEKRFINFQFITQYSPNSISWTLKNSKMCDEMWEQM